jgi:uncharacterized beta-barrel protein YwiB (DUF1934 family)
MDINMFSSEAVSYQLTLTNNLENKSVFYDDLIGVMTKSPLIYRYNENQNDAYVKIQVHEDHVVLERVADSNTEIKFEQNKETQFFIKDASTEFMGEVETISIKKLPQYLYIHYRLWVNNDIIAEQEMELKVKVSDA